MDAGWWVDIRCFIYVNLPIAKQIPLDVPQLASLLFTSYAAHSFRRDVKRWKYFADVMVDIGITLEIIAPSVLSYPLLSRYFMPILCMGNVCKALCGVAAGACGGALQMYWAVKVMGTEEGISEVA